MRFSEMIRRHEAALEKISQPQGCTPPENRADIQCWLDIVDRWAKAPKRVVDPNDDDLVIGKIKHTMRRGEKLMEWYARTLISRASIITMSGAEISAAVAVAERNALDEVGPPRPNFFAAKQQPPPTRPLVMVG